MNYDRNPFPEEDGDRHAIWEMLVRRDIEAHLDADWPRHASDFVTEQFFGIDGSHTSNPDGWRPAFPSLSAYSENWLAFARQCQAIEYAEDRRIATYRATVLRDIDIDGNLAIAHKKFDGTIARTDGTEHRLNWQTVYICRRIDGIWKVTGFVGYLPNPMGNRLAPPSPPVHVPPSRQHVTAGPYSPVLEINASKLIVISGQAAIAEDGGLMAEDFQGQVRATLDNCRRQLAAAGCKLSDVFKVNCYVTDLDNWPLFNAIYVELMGNPLPVRTTVQTGLLPGLLVEIEMWAAKQ